MTTVIFRLWVDGRLMREEEHDLLGDLSELGERHAAQLAGESRPWLVEVELPALPLAERFLRFGTDDRGMVEPQPWPRLRSVSDMGDDL
jgi:hypothetical protein